VGPLKDSQNVIVAGDEEIANVSNYYFASVFTEEGDGQIPEEEGTKQNAELGSVEITEKKISDKIKKLRRNSAPGPDKIGPGLLQQLQVELAPVLAIIFKKSLDSGSVPED
jgi:hypothetical protein